MGFQVGFVRLLGYFKVSLGVLMGFSCCYKGNSKSFSMFQGGYKKVSWSFKGVLEGLIEVSEVPEGLNFVLARS